VAYRLRRYGESLRNLPIRRSRQQLSNLAHLVGIQLGGVDSLASGLSLLPHHVGRVLADGAGEQVTRVDARRIVAVVAHVQPFAEPAIDMLVDDSSHLLSPAVTVDLSIAARKGEGPEDAVVSLRDVGEEVVQPDVRCTSRMIVGLRHSVFSIVG